VRVEVPQDAWAGARVLARVVGDRVSYWELLSCDSKPCVGVVALVEPGDLNHDWQVLDSGAVMLELRGRPILEVYFVLYSPGRGSMRVAARFGDSGEHAEALAMLQSQDRIPLILADPKARAYKVVEADLRRVKAALSALISFSKKISSQTT
jgi:hypothetical protein